MDVTLLAFILSAALSGITVYILTGVMRRRKQPHVSEDSTPPGPITP